MSKPLYSDSNGVISEIAKIELDNSGLTALRSYTLPDVDGILAVSNTVTNGQYLRGDGTNVVMSAIQTSDIQTAITGGASSIVSTNLTVNKALTSDASGKVAAATTTSTELGYVAGVTSPIQTQINNKLSIPTINAQAGNYTAVLTDANSVTIDMTSASANTFTIPTNASVAFPVGSSLTVFRSGAGVTTIQATAGVILNGTSGGSRLIEGQYQGVLLQKKATDTWYIFNK